MIVLGLDPSLTNYGWAIHNTEATGRDRCVDRGRWKTPSTMVEIRRYIYLRDALAACVKDTNPDAVAIESPIFGAEYSEGMYGLFLYSQEALYTSRQNVVFLSVSQIKKHTRLIMGLPDSWQMTKSDMVEGAKEDAGGGRWDHNEADAYLVARLGARFWLFQRGLLSEDNLSTYEHHVFCHKHTFIRGKKAGKTEFKGLMFRENKRYFQWSLEG